MQVELFVLCDAATDQQGKLNILGTFDRIFATKMPAMHPQCAVAARMRYARVERGEHKIRISIVDEDGRAVLPTLDAGMQVVFPDDMASAAFNIVLGMNRMKFEKYGQYSIDLAIDGRQEASLPLLVSGLPQQAQQG